MTEADRSSFLKMMQSHGMRRTVQRFAVYEVMYGSLSHPSVQEVWREARHSVPSITLDTVYRILNEFCEVGIIKKIKNCDMARFDGNLHRHGHFFCTRCGKVLDFPLCGECGESVSANCHDALGEVLIEGVSLHGICHECLASTGD